MYNTTRQEASDLLQISVRSVDRYIKSGKLRMKKEGKNIFIHSGDIDTLQNGGKRARQHVIINNSGKMNTPSNASDTQKVTYSETSISTGKEEVALGHIYADLRKEIEKKDEQIQNLALRVGRAEEIAKNSISINDFKKSQFLLEESKCVLAGELEDVKKEKDILRNKLNYEKQTKLLLLGVSILLFLAFFFTWINTI